MPCISCTEDYTQRFAQRTKGKLTLKKTYDVAFDGADDANAEFIMALSVAGLPAYGQSYGPPYENEYVINKHIEKIEGPHLYKVAVEYENAVWISNESETPEDPLLAKPVIAWGTRKHAEVISKSIDNKPITNSVGKTPSTPITADVYDTTLSFTRNEASFNPLSAALMKGTVNSTTFLGFAAESVLIDDITAEKFWIGQTAYYKVRYEFVINYLGWSLRFLDEGYEEKIEGEIVRIKDDSEPPQDITEPVPLNGNGLRLGEGEDAVFMIYTVKDSASFGSLRISDNDVYGD